jgi:hypothetical protein
MREIDDEMYQARFSGTNEPKEDLTGRCEKIDFKICSELGVKKIAPGCRISDR